MRVPWILLFSLSGVITGWCNACLLNKAVSALWKSLGFMKQEVQNINLDGAIGCRMAGDQLSYLLDSLPLELVYMSHRLRDLQTLAAQVTDEAIGYIRKSQPEYYKRLGPLLNEGQWNLRYPSREVNYSLQIEPKKCSEIVFTEHESDQCISEVLGTNSEENEGCFMSDKCWEMMTSSGYKGYALTHQLFYFQIAEMNRCIPPENMSLVRKVREFQDYFCANILRDAESIEEHDFPDSDQDLFMEQVGLCGLVGYKETFRKRWLQKVIEWQQPNGCYTRKSDHSWICKDQDMAGRKIRQKREEKKLKGNCLSHKTTVAIIALTTSIRFCLEENYLHLNSWKRNKTL